MAGKSSRLALALYRATLQWARTNSDVPFSLRPGDVYALAPHLRGAAVALQDAAAVPPIARAAYDSCRGLKGEEADAALDRALEGVRLLHTVYQQQLNEMRETRRDREDKSGVKYAVGQVFMHKKYGYRAVVYGWDRECERDEEWLRHMNVQNAQQPFYHCLPHEHDCVRLFGGVRITKYVAQDNMEPLAGTRIIHRALDNFFDGYSTSMGRYIPTRKLQYQYPDVYEAEDAAPVGDDANLLAHEEVEAGVGAATPELPPSRDDGRTFASAQP